MCKVYLQRIENAFKKGNVLELACVMGEINVLLATKEITQGEHKKISDFLIDHTTSKNISAIEMLIKTAVTSAEFLVANM